MAIDLPDGSDARTEGEAIWEPLRRRWLRVVILTLVLVGLAYAVLLFVPRSYESTASLLVDSFGAPSADAGTLAVPPQSPDATIYSTMELLRSRDTLLPIVRSLKLAQLQEFSGAPGSPFDQLADLFRPATNVNPEDIALATLRDHLTIARTGEAALLNITVSSSDPALAAQLANAVAKGAAQADMTSLSDIADTSSSLQQQVAGLQQRVSDAESRVAEFRIKNGLYAGAGSAGPIDQQMTNLSMQISGAQTRRDLATSRAGLIRGLLAAGQAIDGVEDIRNSLTIQQLLQQKANLTTQRAQLLATLLPSHPSITALAAQIAAIDTQVANEGRRVATALDAEAKIESTLLDSLQSSLSDLKGRAADETRQTVQLDALEREAKTDRDLLDSYMGRYRDAAASPDAGAGAPRLRVVTLATPADNPISPRIAPVLAAVAALSLAAQAGFILLGGMLSAGRAPARRGQDEEAALTADLSTMDESAAEDETFDPVLDGTDPTPSELEPRGSRHGVLRNWFGRRAVAYPSPVPGDQPPVHGSPLEAASDLDLSPAAIPQPTESATAAEASAERLADLAADIVLGRARIIILGAIEAEDDSELLAARLVADTLRRGLSVARVDAGSRRRTTEPGITDLAGGQADFGDIVHETAGEGLAEIFWGRQSWLDARSSKPHILIEALSDLYEVVIVLAGRIGPESGLPAFARLSSRLVLVGGTTTDPARLDAAWDEAAALGYRQIEAIETIAPWAEVA